jgi:hypothetical protein
MRGSYNEVPERKECPEEVAERLREIAGDNRFGDPMFRIVWGWNRLVEMTGEWQEWNRYEAMLVDKLTGYAEKREFIKLDKSVVETRTVPKYLPGNCWHLEMWRTPEEYGSPDQWGKAGQEVAGVMTLDTSGPYPYQGEYELVYPLTSDLTSHGFCVPLEPMVIEEVMRTIRYGKDNFGFLQRKAAIQQRMAREDAGFVARTADILKDGLRPFASNPFVVVPGGKVN